ILPLLSETSQFDVMSIYQLAGMTNDNYQIPPFRDPHHSASAVSLIGGGANPKPGEVSLAHRGVLFLDEMAEFPKRTLDMLRQPVETEKVTISRTASTVTYPSQDQQKMMQQWASKYNWSTRVQMKILRLARTVSDLRVDEAITNESIWGNSPDMSLKNGIMVNQLIRSKGCWK